ncbi:MAG: major facilitator superfamily domain-containing protein [Monoraphidium minutum]|nr:MAG: major facilitator superfamily domain-containing protein [Monoraphidium minutum]
MAKGGKDAGALDVEDGAHKAPLSMDSEAADGRDVAEAAELESALTKMGRNVLPLCAAVALMNHLDRSNLAYAALSFNRDNGFDASVYALGASLFFVSFCVCQVPANLIMVRVGFRPWLAFLLVGWGAVATSFMFITSPWSFYLCRILLGVFESGAFPAMWFALSVFYPRKRITKPYAYLTISVMGANMLGAPLAAGLIALDGKGGLKGWQWLFLVEGVPSILLAGVILLRLPTSIATAKFLSPRERDALAAAVSCDPVQGPLSYDFRTLMGLVRQVLANRYFWSMFACGTLASIAAASYIAYTPIIINALMEGNVLSSNVSVAASRGGSSSWKPVLLSMVPYTIGVGLSYVVAHSSQRRNEHFYHIIACLGSAGVLMALFAPLAKASAVAGFLSLTLSLAVSFAGQGPGMALIARLCKGREHVVAQPMSNTFNVIGGIVGPLLVAAIINTKGGFTWVTVIMGLVLFVTAIILLLTRFWVMHEGGLPDGGMGRSEVNLKGLDGSNGHSGGAAAGSSSNGCDDAGLGGPGKGENAPAVKARAPKASAV